MALIFAVRFIGKMRLEKFLAEAGITSRRHAKQLIAVGRVTVNNKRVLIPGTHINLGTDVVALDGESIPLKPKKHVYIMLNKPAGYLSTVIDDHDRPSVLALLPSSSIRIYPVGRLDLDTEGLLLLTNDGDLAYKLTHPRYHVDKVYLAWVQGHPSEEALEHLRSGVQLEDGITAPAKIAVIRQTKAQTYLRIIIHEGKKRQIKRMCRAVGHEVQYLKRVQIGPIKLGKLPVGEYRYLSPEELKRITNYELRITN